MTLKDVEIGKWYYHDNPTCITLDGFFKVLERPYKITKVRWVLKSLDFSGYTSGCTCELRLANPLEEAMLDRL